MSITGWTSGEPSVTYNVGTAGPKWYVGNGYWGLSVLTTAAVVTANNNRIVAKAATTAAQVDGVIDIYRVNVVDTDVFSYEILNARDIGHGRSTDNVTSFIPRVLAKGKAQSGTSSTLVLGAGSAFADDELMHSHIAIVSGTGAGQTRHITDYVNSSDTASISPNWFTTPDNTSVYQVFGGGLTNVVRIQNSGTAVTNLTTDYNGTGYNKSASTIGLVAGFTTAGKAEIADAVLDEVVEGSLTLRQLARGYAAALLGKSSGLETTTAIYRDASDTKDRITATVDGLGNRTTVTLDLS